jgi:hypothetical protein
LRAFWLLDHQRPTGFPEKIPRTPMFWVPTPSPVRRWQP